MEKKTIGAFIAVLRKASGMTQRELADKLNVSDKAVSRWERDETAPDLTLIPVIADIFGVTSDELLRGERRSPEKREAEIEDQAPRYSAKSEKQLGNLLRQSLVRFKTRSLTASGIAILGIIAAAILFNITWSNMPPFWLGMALLLAALFCQIAFTVNAAASADDEEILAFRGAPEYLKEVAWISTAVFMLIFMLFLSLTPFLFGFKWDKSLPGWTLQQYLTGDLPIHLALGLIICGAACIIIKGKTDKLMGRRTLWGRKLFIYISVLLLVCAFFIAKDAICSGSVISEQPVNFGALVYIVPAIITAGGALLYALAVKKERAATNKQSAG